MRKIEIIGSVCGLSPIWIGILCATLEVWLRIDHYYVVVIGITLLVVSVLGFGVCCWKVGNEANKGRSQ
jgi:hypothetical protein